MYIVKTLFWGVALFLVLYTFSATYLSLTESFLAFAVGSLAYMQVSDDPKKKVKTKKEENNA